MNVKSIKANQTEVTLSNDTTILVSYETPVCAHIVGEGVIKTEKKWSVTTSKHINSWIRENFPNAEVKEVPQETLDNLI